MTATQQPNGKLWWIIVKWIVAVFLVIGGIGLLGKSFIAGFLVLIAGLFVVPVISEWLKTKFPIWKQKYVRIILPIALFFIASLFLENNQTDKNKENPKIQVNTVDTNQKGDSTVSVKEEIVEPKDTRPLISYTIEKEATVRYDNAPTYYVLIDKVNLQDTLLQVKVERLIDEIVKDKGAMIGIDIFDNKETLEKTYADEVLHQSLNNSAMNALMKLQEKHNIASFDGELKVDKTVSNDLYMFPAATTQTQKLCGIKEYLPTTRNSATAQKQSEDLKNTNAAIEKKKADFEDNCLSAWDGSCIELVKYVKNNMNNPKSFEHVSTTYATLKDYAVVTMTYRGTNGFGATVTEQIRAKVSYDCEVLGIMK